MNALLLFLFAQNKHEYLLKEQVYLLGGGQIVPQRF